MRYIVLGRPALPANPVLCFPSHKRPSFSEIQEIAVKGRLHITDDGIVLFIRRWTPSPRSDLQRPVGSAACLLNDEPVRIYVPMRMRSWVMQVCHSTVSCHLGITCALRMPKHSYRWIVMDICTRW